MTAAPGRAAGAGERPSASTLLGYWLPAVAYVGLIFSLSSIRGTDIPSGFPNMDKLAHLLEYSLLGLLLGRAIRFTMAGRGRVAASFATVLAGALVGMADELYQRGVPGRSSDIRDWMVDVLAVSASVVFTQWVSTRSLRGRGVASTGEEPR
ncbi:MAG TPA: VanZ family protein [Candidatus Eisenbacteria bacterium]|nr:VanZ family protein [Candidatus Eisenbacteria bacterium]